MVRQESTNRPEIQAATQTHRADRRTAVAPVAEQHVVDTKAFIASIMNDKARYEYYLRIAKRIVISQQEAEDMVQDAFVRALTTSVQIDGTKNPNSWFATVVTRIAIDYGRKANRRRENSLDLMAESGALDTLEGLTDTPNLAQGIEAAERSLIVQRAIEAANLSEIKRLLLDGRYGDDDKSYQTLAAECNARGFTKPDGSEIDENYVKATLNRTRKAVKKQFLAASEEDDQ